MIFFFNFTLYILELIVNENIIEWKKNLSNIKILIIIMKINK
jgi:hypothetical protein